MNEDILNINLEKKFPIPGLALTTDPDNPMPHDRPPKLTNLHECIEHIFKNTIAKENYVPLVEVLAKGFPLMEIVQTTLFTGFYHGMWNHSMMLLLIEPVTYIYLAIAERAGIDPVFFRDDVEDDLEEEEVLGMSFEEDKIKSLQQDVEQDKKPHPAITDQMVAQLNNLPSEQLKGILDKQGQSEEEAQQTTPEESLLGQKGGM